MFQPVSSFHGLPFVGPPGEGGGLPEPAGEGRNFPELKIILPQSSGRDKIVL
jgi:hypothetical protein